jgi:hypothetical protein
MGTAARAQGTAVTQVALSPQGVTLKPGQTQLFTAEPRDSQGRPVPGVTVTFRSSRRGVATLTNQGVNQVLVQGSTNGTTTLTAAVGGRATGAGVAVTGDPAGGGTFVGAGLGTVNHVLVDDDFVYWTELAGALVKVRRAPKTGGPITDLAVEPSRDRRGVRIGYVHLQQSGDRLFYSRQTFGFLDHWSIRMISKSGGPSTEILEEDASIEPMLATGWQVVGEHVVVVLTHPEKIKLGADVRVAAYDLANQQWRSLITGRYDNGRLGIVAHAGGIAYVRAVENRSRTDLLAVDPLGPANSFTSLFSDGFVDRALFIPGSANGTQLFEWSDSGSAQALRAFPLTGGTVRSVTTGFLGVGLTADGANLYFFRSPGTLFRIPAAGGTATRVRDRLLAGSALGGTAIDAASIYVTQTFPGNTNTIVRIAK